MTHFIENDNGIVVKYKKKKQMDEMVCWDLL